MRKKSKGIWSVQEFQDCIEGWVRKGYLPKAAVKDFIVKYTHEAYLSTENKMAKLALLNQLAEILVCLRLQNPTKRFERVLSESGLKKSFANELIVAYTRPTKEWL